MGIWMRASAEWTISSGRPAPSLPTRRAMGWHQSSSQGAEGGSPAEEFLWTQVAMVEIALSLNWVSRMSRAAPATSGRWRAAPAEARRALGEKGLAVAGWVGWGGAGPRASLGSGGER